jgi:2'-5' RNA ligase
MRPAGSASETGAVPPADPLVVTLQLDAAAQERFDRERRRLFPPGRTQVGAHLTLFHAVPGEHRAAVAAALAAEQGRDPFEVGVTGVRSLGRGAAYTVECAALGRLRARLAAAWEPWLTPQDRQGFRAHVTVQNKVDPATARATVAALSAAFVPHVVVGTGLELWRYVGGPWELERRFPFTGTDTGA